MVQWSMQGDVCAVEAQVHYFHPLRMKGAFQAEFVLDFDSSRGTGRSIIQFLIARIEQFLNSPIQFIDYMKLINSIRNLQIEAIYDQFAG